MGTFPSTQNTFSVLWDSICHVTPLITNWDKIVDCSNEVVLSLWCHNSWLTPLVLVSYDAGQRNVQIAQGYSSTYLEHSHIVIRPVIDDWNWHHLAFPNFASDFFGLACCRDLWLSLFVRVQNSTSQLYVICVCEYTPQWCKHVRNVTEPYPEWTILLRTWYTKLVLVDPFHRIEIHPFFLVSNLEEIRNYNNNFLWLFRCLNLLLSPFARVKNFSDSCSNYTDLIWLATKTRSYWHWALSRWLPYTTFNLDHNSRQNDESRECKM